MNKNQNTYPIRDRWSYLWLAIGTLLGFIWTIPLTMWLAPVFMLRFVRSQKTWVGFLLSWLSSYIVIAITFRTFLPLPLPEYLITMLITSFTGALAYLADRLLVPRLPGFTSTLVFPLAVTLLDYIGAMTNPMGSIGAQAYAQYGNLELMQLASITGMWGIVFLVNWLGPVVNWAWERKFEWKEIKRGTFVYAGILLLVMVFGSVRLAFASTPNGTVRMHGITMVDMRQELEGLHDALRNDRQEYREKTAEMRELYLDATIQEARSGAQVVHWPEMAVFAPEEDEAEFLDQAAEIARQEGIYLVIPMGTEFQDGSKWENKLLIFDPSGEMVLEHHKYGNALAEGSRPGNGVLQTAETPFGTISGVICNDTNHQEVIAQAGRNGTDVLFSPSLEIRGIDPMHAHMAAFRAIENGVVLVRQADNGLSIVVDPYGHILAETDHFTSSDRSTIAQVPVYSVLTLYSYTPDLFAWLAIGGFLVITIAAIILGRRAKRAAAVQAEAQPEPVS